MCLGFSFDALGLSDYAIGRRESHTEAALQRSILNSSNGKTRSRAGVPANFPFEVGVETLLIRDRLSQIASRRAESNRHPQPSFVIRSENLCKAYGPKKVLQNVNLEVSPGEVFGFVGPNGAGKSTFLKCLIGVVRPDSGSAQVAGCNILKESVELRRKIGYAPSETALYNRMTVRQLVHFSIAFHPQADVQRADEMIERFGLPHDRKVGRLSHGMKRKLILAQALSVQAEVLLLDEPMEGLDPDVRRQVEDILKVEAQNGTTVFFSSHDLASVQRICHRVAFLREGRILEIGTLGDLLAKANQVLQLTLREPHALAELPQIADAHWQGEGIRWQLAFQGNLEEVLRSIQALPLAGLRDASGSLEDVFDALYRPSLEGTGV